MLIAFNKPYGVLSQFTTDGDRPTLADYIDVPRVYAAGRLDHDSEGLLLLTDDGRLQDAITAPAHRLAKRYWAQVEGVPDVAALARFSAGLEVGSGADRYRAQPASARAIVDPALPERDPPIRFRARVPTTWIEVTLVEGRNRQVRRMTAAIGHPTLRLLRVGIGPVDLFALGIAPGGWKPVEADRLLDASKPAKPRPPRERSFLHGPLSTGFRNRR
jgi:23S rRNA pseudouridine2457 synthase